MKNKSVPFSALVIGAGVSGLTTGIRLAENGHRVEIWTEEDPQETTSATAAAFWEPYIVGPPDQVVRWGKVTFDQFARIAAESGAKAGVAERRLLSVFRNYPKTPEWSAVVPTLRRMTREELEEAFEGDLPDEFLYGFSFRTWMVEMPKYLEYLRRTFEGYGNITLRKVGSVDEAFAGHDLVVNCSALGSRDIGGIKDKSVYAIAGQVVQIPRTIERTILLDAEGVTYIVPRGDNTILGGTAQENLYDRTPLTETTVDIVKRCGAFFPDVAKRDIQLVKVGLRPARPVVRLEAEDMPEAKRLIHNYGHGGAGVTLSWGCADDVVALARD
ncbi:MAG: FAD-dependent oxidoreductase [Candidatus Sulfobium sp.]